MLKPLEPGFASTLLSSFLDPDNQKIINCAIGTKPKTSKQIIHLTKVPQTTAYRKIKNLLEKKVLIYKGFKFYDGSKIFLYQTCFKKIKFIINGKQINARIKV